MFVNVSFILLKKNVGVFDGLDLVLQERLRLFEEKLNRYNKINKGN